jgi:hypothetical protein
MRPAIGGNQHLPVEAVEARLADILDLHLRRTGALEVEHLGRRRRYIDDPALGEGAAIVDADDDGAVVAEIGDAHIAGQRQRRMGCCQLAHVVKLAIGRLAAVEGAPVPGSQSNRGVIRIFARLVDLAPDLIGIADLVAAAALRNLFSVGHQPRAGRDAIFGFAEIFLGSRGGGSLLGMRRRRRAGSHDRSGRNDHQTGDEPPLPAEQIKLSRANRHAPRFPPHPTARLIDRRITLNQR